MSGSDLYKDKYFLDKSSDEKEIETFIDLAVSGLDLSNTLKKIRDTKYISVAERKKVIREVTSRPQQAYFRNKVINACNTSCILTGVSLGSVLEAAHIVPVSKNGSDELGNGLCLRSDIHILFDSGHLRILMKEIKFL